MNKTELIEALYRNQIYFSDMDILAPVPGDMPVEHKQAFNAGINKAISLVEQLEDPREDMRKLAEALEFYADEQTYNLPNNVLLPNFNGHMPISADRGRIAKQALTNYKEKYGL